MAAGRVQAQSYQVTTPEAIAYAPQQPHSMLLASRAGTELPRYAPAPLTARPTVSLSLRQQKPQNLFTGASTIIYVECMVG